MRDGRCGVGVRLRDSASVFAPSIWELDNIGSLVKLPIGSWTTITSMIEIPSRKLVRVGLDRSNEQDGLCGSGDPASPVTMGQLMSAVRRTSQ